MDYRDLIVKQKEVCFLTGSKEDLTFHHIIPRREFENNLDENIMILNREVHIIIDKKKHKRTKNIYNKNKEIIDKYNYFLIKKGFDKKYFWEINKPIIKKVNHKILRISKRRSRQYREYIQKRDKKKATRKRGLTPWEKKKLNENK